MLSSTALESHQESELNVTICGVCFLVRNLQLKLDISIYVDPGMELWWCQKWDLTQNSATCANLVHEVLYTVLEYSGHSVR